MRLARYVVEYGLHGNLLVNAIETKTSGPNRKIKKNKRPRKRVR